MSLESTARASASHLGTSRRSIEFSYKGRQLSVPLPALLLGESDLFRESFCDDDKKEEHHRKGQQGRTTNEVEK